MVVVAIRYMILAVERFKNSDDRSIEELFYGVQREIVNELIDCAIVLMIDTLLDSNSFSDAQCSIIGDDMPIFSMRSMSDNISEKDLRICKNRQALSI